MDENETHQNEKQNATELCNALKKEHKDIDRIEIENDCVLIIYASDDTLWQILDDYMGHLTVEFEAGSGEPHFLRMII